MLSSGLGGEGSGKGLTQCVAPAAAQMAALGQI